MLIPLGTINKIVLLLCRSERATHLTFLKRASLPVASFLAHWKFGCILLQEFFFLIVLNTSNSDRNEVIFNFSKSWPCGKYTCAFPTDRSTAWRGANEDLHLLTHSFNTYFLRTYYVPGMVVSHRNTEESTRDVTQLSWGWDFRGEVSKHSSKQ